MMESHYNMEKNMESLLIDILFSTPKRIKIVVDFVKRLLQVRFWYIVHFHKLDIKNKHQTQ